jgi:hypothetical protein
MKRSIFALFALYISIGLLFTTPTVLNAQFGLDSADVNVNIYPEEPEPNQSVDVVLESYVTDINKAKITWLVNGVEKKSGNGLKNFTFTTGNAGVTTTLGIIIVTAEGQTVNITRRLRPFSIDLMWQSESYTPPFYKGKALFSPQNTITIIAMPHMTNSSGSEVSPKNLTYRWLKNGTVQDADSGYGKNTYTFTQGVIARPFEIMVEVSNSDSSSTGFARIDVPMNDPFILFYKKSPLYGIEFQNALSGKVKLTNSKEIAVVGVPFFFGTTNQNIGLMYKWAINGILIDNNFKETTRIFRQIEGTSGSSKISLSVEHGGKILQLANSMFDIEFGNTEEKQGSF